MPDEPQVVTWNDPYAGREEARQQALRRLRQDEGRLGRLQERLNKYGEAATSARRIVAEINAQSRNWISLRQLREDLEAKSVTKKNMTPEQKAQIELARGHDHLQTIAAGLHVLLQRVDQA